MGSWVFVLRGVKALTSPVALRDLGTGHGSHFASHLGRALALAQSWLPALDLRSPQRLHVRGGAADVELLPWAPQQQTVITLRETKGKRAK